MTDRPWLFFDVDDTFVDTFRTSIAKYAVLAERFGHPAPTAEDLIAVGYGVRSFQACAGSLFPHVASDLVSAVYDALGDKVPPMPLGDAISVVVAAKELGYGVAVLTNGPRQKTSRKLEAAGVPARVFDLVVTADDCRVPKPDPRAFADMCNRVDADPTVSWYVSDSPSDWASCEAVGIGSIGVIGGRPLDPTGWSLPRLAIADVGALVDLLPVLPPPGGALVDVWAVTFDVGDTLLVSTVDVAARLGCSPCTNSAATATTDQLARAVDLPGTWTSDDANRRNLVSAYSALAGAGTAHEARAVAADLYDDVTSSDGWRVVDARIPDVRRLTASPLKTGVISNWQSSLADTLTTHGLQGFDAVITSCQTGHAKPDQAIFDTACRVLQVEPGALLHAGDGPSPDVAGALQAGSRAAYLRLQDLRLLTDIVQRLGRKRREPEEWEC